MKGMRRFILDLQLKSPVHVGLGADHDHPAYAYLPDQERNEVVLLDPTRLVVELEESRRRVFLEAVASGPVRAQRLLRDWYKEGVPLPVVGRLPASQAFLRTVETASGNAELDFRPLPRSIKGPYLPASSVKGALRTAWLYAELEPILEENDLVFDPRSHEWHEESKRDDEGMIRPHNGGLWEAQSLEAYALGYLGKRRPDMYKDPFRAVRLGDGPALSTTRLERVGVVHPQNRLKDVAILAEVIPQGTRLRLPLRHHEALVQENIVSKSIAPEELGEAARVFYFGVLEAEWEYAEENGWNKAAQFYAELAKEIENHEDVFPLRFGFGSGKVANTLLFLLDEPWPKTRKAAGSSEPYLGIPLGWAVGKLIEHKQ